jgi:hypothetical protein
MHLFYIVWDYTDERFFSKLNSSDCTQFSFLLGWPASIWFVMWTTFSVGVFIAAIFAGIMVFQKTPEDMYGDA